MLSFILLAPGYAQQSLPFNKIEFQIITITFMIHNSLSQIGVLIYYILQGERVIYKVAPSQD
jgi:hypothetical protein